MVKTYITKIKAYIPVKKTKTDKPLIRGLWYSKGQGLCYDYINRVTIGKGLLKALQLKHKQEAIFYTRKGKGYIWYNKNREDTLKHCQYFAFDKGKRGLKNRLRGLLQDFGGVTVYIREKNYLFEVWS